MQHKRGRLTDSEKLERRERSISEKLERRERSISWGGVGG